MLNMKNILEFLAYSKFLHVENSLERTFLHEWICYGLKDNFISSQTLWNTGIYWIIKFQKHYMKWVCKFTNFSYCNGIDWN